MTSDQLCEICGKPNAPFGYGPPHHPQTIWRCGEHRLEGPVPRLPLFPRFLELDPAEVIQRMVKEQIEADWPTVTDSSTCRHCGRKDEKLDSVGTAHARGSGCITIAATCSEPSLNAGRGRDGV